MNSERLTLINPPARPVGPPQQKSRVGLIVGIIVLAVIAIVLIVIVIVLAFRKQKVKLECTADSGCSGGKVCVNNVCSSCRTPTERPQNVTINVSGTEATLTWSAVTGAKSYNVYRKLEDPSVGVNNFNQREGTTALTRTFTTLSAGTHYFVITALNDCGESQPSSPVSIAPICDSVPTAPAAPTVTQTTDDCAGTTASDIIQVSFADLSIPHGVYVIQGTGQKGNVSNYLYLVQGSSWGPATGIHLKCGGTSTDHTVTQITDVHSAPLTVTGPVTTGTTFTVTWQALAGSEQYVVFLVGVDGSTGTPHFYGNYAPASATSLTLDTNNGDTLVFGLVLGFRTCDKSPASGITSYTTA